MTSTVPDPGGEVAVICVSLTMDTDTAPVAPNFTAVAPVKPEPVMVTVVPPPAGPLVGATRVTAGAAP